MGAVASAFGQIGVSFEQKQLNTNAIFLDENIIHMKKIHFKTWTQNFSLQMNNWNLMYIMFFFIHSTKNIYCNAGATMLSYKTTRAA